MWLNTKLTYMASSPNTVSLPIWPGVDSSRFRERLGANLPMFAAGDQLNPTFDLNSISDDIGGSNGGRSLRAKIRRVEIDLLGLALDTDPSWVDWSDPDPATRPYRKFRLTGDFRPRNVGVTGIEDTGGTGFGNL